MVGQELNQALGPMLSSLFYTVTTERHMGTLDEVDAVSEGWVLFTAA